LNKGELINTVADRLDVSNRESELILSTILEVIIKGAVAGECVLPGLGKIVKTETAARTGVSRLGDEPKVWSKPAGYTLKLRLSKAGKALC
jgi:nucleoid DNA-binding protein